MAGTRVRDPEAVVLRTIALCFVAALFEGVDIQSAGVAAPRMGPAFHLARQSLGLVFSASTLGLALGAALGGRWADRIGRKQALVAAMIAFGAFSLATTLARDLGVLLWMRVLTGIGLGGALPNMIALAAENAPPERRGLAIALIYCGMPLGGTLAAALTLLWPDDWRTIFYIGGAAPLLAAPLLALLLPESRSFRALPPSRARVPVLPGLFGPGRAVNTVGLWLGFALTVMVLYLMINWLPTLMIGRQFTPRAASLMQMVFNVGGTLGAVVIGALMDSRRRARTVVLVYALIGVSLALLGAVALGLAATAALVFAVGVSLVGGQAIIYAIAPLCYETAFRGTALGGAVAAGRIGAIIGPLLAGLLLAAGLSGGGMLLCMLPAIAIAAGLAIMLERRTRAAARAPPQAAG